MTGALSPQMPPPSSVPAVSRMDQHSRTDLPRLYWKLAVKMSVTEFSLFYRPFFPAEPRLTGYSEAKDDGSGGSNWNNITCKAPVNRSPTSMVKCTCSIRLCGTVSGPLHSPKM